jgi:glycine/D-amino acid oxidase-like deaminating enzyme
MGLEDAWIEAVDVGFRPIPEDGLPITGFAPSIGGLYVTVMHAGVTLAPIVGRLAAAEIVDDASVALLEPFRLDRFR